MATDHEKAAGVFSHAVLVVPADSDFANGEYFQAVYVGGAGNIRFTTTQGDDILFTAVPVGTVLRLKYKRIWATNTTATLLVALGNPSTI